MPSILHEKTSNALGVARRNNKGAATVLVPEGTTEKEILDHMKLIRENGHAVWCDERELGKRKLQITLNGNGR